VKKNMACADLFESPRISFSNDFGDIAVSVEGNRGIHGDGDEDFEFCMAVPEDPRSGIKMMSADELFYQGKLLPFQFPKPAIPDSNPVVPGSIAVNSNAVAEDPSPKAPKFSSSRWKELLGLKTPQTPTPAPKPSKNPKSLKNLLSEGIEPSTSPSQPLLPPRDSDADCASARFSIQSLDPDLDELPRYSVDSINEDSVLRKPLRVNIKPSVAQQMNSKDSKARIDRSRVRNTSPKRFSESPRRNASGKIVFKGLERSCSSPSSLNMRKKDAHYSRKGFERSYSANVRVTPVLNVPVCIRSGKGSKGGMFGLSHLFSSNKPNRNPNPNPNPNLNPSPCQTKQSSRER
jgi:hypothetical protein